MDFPLSSVLQRKCPTCSTNCKEPFIENLSFLDFQDQYLDMIKKIKNGDPIEEEEDEVEIMEEMEENRIECSECEKETKMSQLRECWKRPCEKPICWNCVASIHSEHITSPYSPNADHLTVYESHKSIDISRFPDRRVLDVQGMVFDVSASLLATHSPFFYEMFYGSAEKRSQTHFELDEEPWTFIDLLDIMMMKQNKSKCCDQCIGPMHGPRVRMAERLQLIYVLNHLASIPRPNRDGVSKFPMCKQQEIDVIHRKNKWSYRFRITRDIPDARFMRVGSTRFLVSSSTLSLFSPHFMNLFYKGENENELEMIFDLTDDCVVFSELLEVVNGSIIRGISPETLSLLDKLDRLDAVFWIEIKATEYDRSRLVKVVEGIMKWKHGKNDLTDEEIMTIMKLLDQDEITSAYEMIANSLRRRIKRLRGE
ncbi:hypothetical protein PENTCL1PPCAC_17601, partial [Pristionchus entomophagus]